MVVEMITKLRNRLLILAKWLCQCTASNWFFIAMLGLFTFETLYLAFTSRYPMAFDENYHFILIQFFSHRLDPLVTSQPASSYHLGNIVGNPSFMYHYLLSFPYRIIAHFTNSVKIQVIGLRLINVSFAIGSLLLIHKTFQQLQLPRVVSNLAIFSFALTPIFCVLSAQINYDNLLIFAVVASLFLVAKIIEQLRLTRQVPIRETLILATICVWASLVKYAFLPILVGLVISAVLIVLAKRQQIKWKNSYTVLKSHSKFGLAGILVALIVGATLFVTVYGTNVIRYHNPVPQCNQVLSITDCKQYYAWDRNYILASTKPANEKLLGVVHYSVLWLKEVYYQLFAEIVPAATGGLIPIARDYYILLLALTALGIVCTLPVLPRLLHMYPALSVFSVVVISYTLFLWSRNYHDYRQLGQAVAIQGRYMLPVLAYLYVLIGLGIQYSLGLSRMRFLRPITAFTVIVAFIYFGGCVRYVAKISPTTGWKSSAYGIVHTAEIMPPNMS
jgi:hypothetical protein